MSSGTARLELEKEQDLLSERPVASAPEPPCVPIPDSDPAEEVSIQVSSASKPASAAEALTMLESAIDYLAAADPTGMAAEAQAQALVGLERLDAVETAARASILGAFTAGRGYAADADYSPRAWLIHKTRITRGAAAGHLAWARRAAAHPQVVAALAARDLPSESYARTICSWTEKLPGPCWQDADTILIAAARGGADLRGLAELAAEIYARSLPDSGEDEPDDRFDDRSVRIETTFGGAGVISGNLTAECSAAVTSVLEALSAPAGAEDVRTHDQRFHDGLQEAMRRLLAAGLLPERAGQPTKALVHVSVAELCAMDAGSALQQEWIAHVRGRWAAARAGASVTGSDGAAWLDGAAARAVTCDATLTPVVTGDIDTDVLDDMVRLCVQLARIDHCPADSCPADSGPAAGEPAGPCPAEDAPGTARSREALQQAIIGKAVGLLSGPGGLASFLRTRLLDARLAGPSLPLDVGISRDIPAAIRQAVILRARGHCEWAGGCDQPAAACEVHHLRHRANGGKTSVMDCGLYCTFHHQVVIHRWGWTVTLNPDGTTTARSPDGSKVFRSHGPPARAG
jgi:hypothetical protein